ncbi:translocation protein [Meredithblackwellia eburnea MCA 4105]
MENAPKPPPELKLLATWLRSNSQIKLKTGVLQGKRIDYFKGKSAIKALLSPAYANLGPKYPKITSEEQAIQTLNSLIPFVIYLRVLRGHSVSGSGGPKLLQVNPQQQFLPDDYYAWFLPANQTKTLLMGVGMVVAVLAAVMFPLWPAKLRVGVWYLSIAVLGLIGLFFAIAVVRLIFYVITIVVAKPGIWIFPNLFEDVGFVDSFIPLWAWDLPPPKKVKGEKSSKKRSSSKKDKADKGGSATASGIDEPATGGPKIVELAEGED